MRNVGQTGVHDHLEMGNSFHDWDESAVDFEGQDRDFTPHLRRQADFPMKYDGFELLGAYG